MLDLSATSARKIATKQRLEHQDQRVLAFAAKPLPEHVARDGPHLTDRDTHGGQMVAPVMANQTPRAQSKKNQWGTNSGHRSPVVNA